MKDIWILEARHPDGRLDLSGPQPADYFGFAAISGMDDWAMSRVIYHRCPDAVLCGDNIAHWPALLDARFIARRKTW